MRLSTTKVIFALVLLLIPIEVFAMEWTKILPLAKAQDVYFSNEISLLFEISNDYIFFYKDGGKYAYSIVVFDDGGNIKETMEYKILPDYIANVKNGVMILGRDSSRNNIYAIINNKSILSCDYGKNVIPLSVFSVEVNRKNLFIISYGDFDRGTAQNPAIIYKIINEGGDVIYDGILPTNLLGILYPYVIDNHIYLLSIDSDRNAHTVKLSSTYSYDGQIDLGMHFDDNLDFKKNIFLSDKIFMMMENRKDEGFLYEFDIKTLKFSMINLHGEYTPVLDIVKYGNDRVALLYDKYILIYNLEYKKEYVADLSYLNMQIERLLYVEDNSVIIAGYTVEPTGGFHPILKRVTIHPVPR